MRFLQHHSGSSGNLYEVIAGNGSRLIIDPGVTWKKIQKALNYDLNNIIGAMCSHRHKDHSKALADVRRSGIDVFASRETLHSARITGRGVTAIKDGDLVKDLGGFQVYCFDTVHDCDGSLGFYVLEEKTDELLFFATDTFCIPQRSKWQPNIVAIECNFLKETLEAREASGDINTEVAKRLWTAHMEKQTAIDYLENYCDLGLCHTIHLLHMSSSNIDKEATVKEFEKRFMIDVKVV